MASFIITERPDSQRLLNDFQSTPTYDTTYRQRLVACIVARSVLLSGKRTTLWSESLVTISSADTLIPLDFIRSDSIFFLNGPAVGNSRSLFMLKSIAVTVSFPVGKLVEELRTSFTILKSAMIDSFRESSSSMILFLFSISLVMESNSEGGNLAASKIRNLECPSYEICLIDYGCGKFNRKIHIMEQYP